MAAIDFPEVPTPGIVLEVSRLRESNRAVHDGDLAEATLDRLLERGAHFAMRGRSYRTRHVREEERPIPPAKTA